MNKTFMHVAGIAILYSGYFALIYMMAMYTEPWLQALNVLPMTLDGPAYRDSFRNWALLVMGVSLVATVFWYWLAEAKFCVATPTVHSKRTAWAVAFVPLILAGLAAEFLGPKAQGNAYIPRLFFFLGGTGFYYLATLLFSPVSYKYTPLGASKIRAW